MFNAVHACIRILPRAGRDDTTLTMNESPAMGAVVLGVLQGITEFLPVSSDGHLAAFALLFGAAPISLQHVVVLHAGTLISTVVVLRDDLRGLWQALWGSRRNLAAFVAESAQGRLLAVIVAACLPTAAIGLALEHVATEANRHAMIVGAGFLVSAGAALLTRRPRSTRDTLSLRAALLLGAVQGIAVLPGVSRSGCTIACAIALGLAPAAAFRLSFLLSIPAVGGAMLLELGSVDALAATTPSAWLGAAIAGIVGYAALRLLRQLLTRGHFWLFAWYLIPLGLFLILIDVVGKAGG